MPIEGALQLPQGMNATEVTLPDGGLCHYITDDQLERLGQMQQEPVMEIFLASIGVFFGSVISSIDGLARFGNSTDPTTVTDLFSMFLTVASLGVTVVTGYLWRVRHKGRESMVETIRSRQRVRVVADNG